jgi:DNA-binding NtrC family response regulator
MTILYLENNDHISNFFFKLFQTYDLKFHHISRLQSCEDYLTLSTQDTNSDLLLVNAVIDDKDMFSYSAYMKRKLNLNIPVIVYTNNNIIENSIRAKQSGVEHFFVLPALPYDIVTSINDVMRHSNTGNDNRIDKTDILPQTHSPHNKGISVLFKEYLDKYFSAHLDLEPSTGLYERIMNEIEPQIILSSLEYTNGNRLKAADILGINRNTLRKKMTQYKIDTINVS